ncbi:hypothetical protein TorRG33x02_322110, partial [Trema orientale]
MLSMIMTMILRVIHGVHRPLLPLHATILQVHDLRRHRNRISTLSASRMPAIYRHCHRRRRHLRGHLIVDDPLVDILQVAVNQPAEVIQIHGIEAFQAHIVPSQTLGDDLPQLPLPVIVPQPLQLVAGLGDSLTQETLLVHHVLALLHLRHLSELRHDALDSRSRRERLRLSLVRTADDCTRVDTAEGAQLAQLLHEALLSLLECRFSRPVVADVGQIQLLSGHGGLRQESGEEWEINEKVYGFFLSFA